MNNDHYEPHQSDTFAIRANLHRHVGPFRQRLRRPYERSGCHTRVNYRLQQISRWFAKFRRTDDGLAKPTDFTTYRGSQRIWFQSVFRSQDETIGDQDRCNRHLVVSLFLLVVFALKLKPNGQGRQKKGDKVLTVLGKVPFVHGQQLQLVRLGTRMLLVASSAKGSQTLSEITDPAEVLQIESAFRAGRMDLITDSLSRSEPSANGSQSNNGILLGSNQRNGRTLLEA